MNGDETKEDAIAAGNRALCFLIEETDKNGVLIILTVGENNGEIVCVYIC